MVAAGTVLNERYRLERKIGQGGFAQVFLAYGPPNFKRPVAIKVLLPDQSGDDDFLHLFVAEAERVATLEHPNILSMYDYGEAEGTAYLVMPYITGGTLHDRLRTGPALGLIQIGDYLRQAAAALDYAHRRNLIHRDVKPQNMLLRAEDDHLLLADFGISKVLSSASALSATRFIGTLAYMAPEQFRGQVGRASDIYALGCVLFQLLTGAPPYNGPTEEVIHGHLHAPIPALAERSQGRLPAALQGIIERALAKSPDERFASAGALANAFTSAAVGVPPPGSPVPSATVAVPPLPPLSPATPSPAPAEEAPTSGSQLAPTTPTTGSLRTDAHYPRVAQGTTELPTSRIPAAERPADDRAQVTVAQPPNPSFLDRLLRKKAALLGGGIGTSLAALMLVVMVVRGNAGNDNQQPGDSTATAPTMAALATSASPTAIVTAITQPSSEPAPTTAPVPTTAPPSVASPVTATAAPFQSQNFTPLSGHAGWVNGVAWSPDGKTLASASDDGTVQLWRADGTKARPPLSGHRGVVKSVAWSPDSTILASASDDRTVRLWDADGREVTAPFNHNDKVRTLAWSPDSQTLATGSADKTVRLWSRDGTERATLRDHDNLINRVAWSPDGTTLASASVDKTVRLWRADGAAVRRADGTPLTLNHDRPIWSVAWSPDGRTLATASDDQTARLWGADGAPLATLTGHTAPVLDVAWSPEGKVLASMSNDSTVRLWAPDGKAVATLAGHARAIPVLTVAWSPNGQMLASGSGDRTVRLWTPDGKEVAALASHDNRVLSVAWSPDSKILASGAADNTVRLWRQ